MIHHYRFSAYLIQLGTGLTLLLSLVLPWHEAHGSGFALLRHATRAEAGLMFLNPQGEVVFSISPWLLAFMPFIGVALLMLRALNGMTFPTLTSSLAWAMNAFLITMLGWLWFFVFLGPNLQWGVLSGVFSVMTLFGAVTLETSLPKDEFDADWLGHLHRTDPERARGYYKTCPRCDETNYPDAKICQRCGFILVDVQAQR